MVYQAELSIHQVNNNYFSIMGCNGLRSDIIRCLQPYLQYAFVNLTCVICGVWATVGRTMMTEVAVAKDTQLLGHSSVASEISYFSILYCPIFQETSRHINGFLDQ